MCDKAVDTCPFDDDRFDENYLEIIVFIGLIAFVISINNVMHLKRGRWAINVYSIASDKSVGTVYGKKQKVVE